jgi:Fur family ferric uptake transcriptional regulator
MQDASIEKNYRAYLAGNGMLFTKERAVILSSVLSREDHFSADDLLFHMRQEGLEVSRATLYRNLKLLSQANLLVEVDFGHGHIHYEKCIGTAPHEHLVCKACGTVIEVNTSKFSEAVEKVATQAGFMVDHHQLKIFGTCQKCQAGKAEKTNP